MCHRHPRPVSPSSPPEPRLSAVLTWSTRSLPCTLVLVDVPDVSHRGWSPGLLIPWSKPHVCPSPLQVHRHTTRLYLTFSSPSTTASDLYTCTPQAKRYVAHIAYAMVMSVTSSTYLWITLTITYHKTHRKSTSRLCVRTEVAVVVTNRLCKWIGKRTSSPPQLLRLMQPPSTIEIRLPSRYFT
jgi:hypothetical protein